MSPLWAPLTAPRMRPARARRTLTLCCALAAVLTCGAAADARTVAPSPRSGEDRARDVFDEVPEAGRPAPSPGTTILLAGLDRRRGIPKAERDRLHVNGKECDCTDVLMLLHISADRRHVRVVSIPRDSYVRFAPHRDHGRDGTGKVRDRTSRHLGKINSAYEHGGPALTVRTVEQATGVRVDHYAETGFTGFEQAVDRIRGAKVCSDKALEDVNSGLRLPPGTHVLSGNGALRYVRARHVEPPGDLGRMRRQQRMLVELLRTLTGERMDGPLEVARAAAELHGAVRRDKALTPGRIFRLAAELRGLAPDRTEFATVPLLHFDHRVPGWGSTLRWDAPRARALFADLRADRPLTGDPATAPEPGATPVPYRPEKVTVRVAGGGERAERMAQELRDDDFRVRESRADAGSSQVVRTEIRYGPRVRRLAGTLAAALPEAVLRPRKTTGRKPSEDFTVYPGREGTRVADVVYDRSSVEGAPVRGDRLDCD